LVWGRRRGVERRWNRPIPPTRLAGPRRIRRRDPRRRLRRPRRWRARWVRRTRGRPGWPGAVRGTRNHRGPHEPDGPSGSRVGVAAPFAAWASSFAGFGVPVISGAAELSATGTVFGAEPQGPPVVPQVVWVAVSAVGLAGLGAPAISGAVVALVGLAAGWAGLGVSAFWVAVSGVGCRLRWLWRPGVRGAGVGHGLGWLRCRGGFGCRGIG